MTEDWFHFSVVTFGKADFKEVVFSLELITVQMVCALYLNDVDSLVSMVSIVFLPSVHIRQMKTSDGMLTMAYIPSTTNQ